MILLQNGPLSRFLQCMVWMPFMQNFSFHLKQACTFSFFGFNILQITNFGLCRDFCVSLERSWRWSWGIDRKSSSYPPSNPSSAWWALHTTGVTIATGERFCDSKWVSKWVSKFDSTIDWRAVRPWDASGRDASSWRGNWLSISRRVGFPLFHKSCWTNYDVIPYFY